MLSLFGRLAAAMVFLLGFSVVTAWAWDSSDRADGRSDITQPQLVQTSHAPSQQ
ncbi:hypothetical protein WGP40_09145 [Brachymonas sp. G13]|uniref:hypothetical protein n=1 Tax=Brachymonas TaxID=28219 RepID=UPI0016B1E849|nr:hypothetical protein [Brachymonas sp. J145]MEE1653325.1 hypothetical protein [Brachymonas sp. J145]NLX16091.1 hypothetical protein [Ramlibacter sp.]